MDEFTPERVHLVVDGQVLGHAQGRLDGEWEEEWMELSVDEGYKAHGLMLGGGFFYLGSDSAGVAGVPAPAASMAKLVMKVVYSPA